MYVHALALGLNNDLIFSTYNRPIASDYSFVHVFRCCTSIILQAYALLMIPAFYFEMKPLKGGLTNVDRGDVHMIL